MTFRQYKNLSETDQELVFWSRAVEVASRIDNDSLYSLFQVDGFYIEVQYSIQFSVIIGFTAFDDIIHLDPYLAQMHIQIQD